MKKFAFLGSPGYDRFTDFFHNSRSNRDTFEDLVNFELLRQSSRCRKPTCRQQMILTANERYKGGFCYQCRRCGSKKSATERNIIF